MRFGIREICDVVLRAKSYQTLGNRKFYKNEPVLYFDTLKTSTLEGAATTVYAQGGRGNTRLVAWEGERTLTFTMEDALLSMESFAILSGAGLMDAGPEKGKEIYVHQTSQLQIDVDNTIELPEDVKACWNGFSDTNDPYYHKSADIFVMVLNNGEVAEEPCIPVGVDNTGDHSVLTCYSHNGLLPKDSVVLVDYYVKRTGGAQMIEITADKFGGNYYLEASTLFRRESDGVDMPAEFIIPNCKVQSNFTFSLAASGDPSTFTFTMDAFPDYTKFDPTHKVLAAIQVITDESGETEGVRQPCESAEDMNTNKAAVKSNESTVTAYICGDDNNNIVVTGTSTGDNYDKDLFGTVPVDVTEITLTLPTSKDGGDYTVIQNNPALAHFSGNGVVGTKKTKTYTVSAGDTLDYSFLVSEDGGPIDIELQKADGTSIVKYVIATAVKFPG